MRRIIPILTALILIHACAPRPTQQGSSGPPMAPDQLPMNIVYLNDLSAFQSTGSNWNIAGDVYADYQEKHHLETSEGTGVLVNINTDDAREHLFTEWEHGDLELMIDIMMPQGSNSGIYFQGRYEIQLFDSWGIEKIRHADIGGIYQRWDETRPEGEKGFEGHPPAINASKAPGLWQTLHVLFRAPTFDDAGNKVDNARFEWVYLNGVKIHDETELTGPTRSAAFEDEVSQAPLMIQGDHGPVALRNIRYKKYGDETLTVQNMKYEVYDYAGDVLPEIDTLTLIGEGETDSFNVAALTPQREHFAMDITGELVVPREGDYLFQTLLDDGGNLYIDDELVVYNGGELEFEQLGGIVRLTEGVHKLRLVFFQVTWRAHATIFYEGPEIEKQILASIDLSQRGSDPDPVVVTPGDAPEMVRGFINYGEEKRTHVLTVGDPSGVHYSYDLTEGTLILCWKGPFADVTEMWVNRGHAQLLKPVNTTIETTAGVPVALLSEASAVWPEEVPSDYKAIGYTINEHQRPVFEYDYQGIAMSDEIYPSEEGNALMRNVQFESDQSAEGLTFRIAVGKAIDQLPNGLYRVEGKYYISYDSSEDSGEPEITTMGDQKALIVPIMLSNGRSTISYSVIW